MHGPHVLFQMPVFPELVAGGSKNAFDKFRIGNPGAGRRRREAGEWLDARIGIGFQYHRVSLRIGPEIDSRIAAHSQEVPRAARQGGQ